MATTRLTPFSKFFITCIILAVIYFGGGHVLTKYFGKSIPKWDVIVPKESPANELQASPETEKVDQQELQNIKLIEEVYQQELQRMKQLEEMQKVRDSIAMSDVQEVKYDEKTQEASPLKKEKTRKTQKKQKSQDLEQSTSVKPKVTTDQVITEPKNKKALKVKFKEDENPDEHN